MAAKSKGAGRVPTTGRRAGPASQYRGVSAQLSPRFRLRLRRRRSGTPSSCRTVRRRGPGQKRPGTGVPGDQYRHCKPMLLIGASGALLTQAGITAATPSDESDPGLLQIDREQLKQGLQSFVDALTRHRIFERETDPPAI